MANEKSSTVTTGMRVGDTEAIRIQIGREATVSDQGRQAAPANPPTGKEGYTVGSQVTVGPIKEVDSRVICGSHKGAPSEQRTLSTDAFKNPPSPRGQMRGQQNSRSYNENGAAFKSTSNAADSEAGN